MLSRLDGHASLALVPPGSEMVAGIRAPLLHGKFDNIAFITNANRIDLSDFIAITGSDPSRIFNQVIFTASSGQSGKTIEHSILVSGHFDQDRIFRAQSANETMIRYRGLAVLVLSRFERERSFFKQWRWLVFIGPGVAIFGTVCSVEVEIGRSLAGSTPDAAVVQRLAGLRLNDEEWSLLPPISHGITVLSQLRLLDPILASLAQEGGSLAFGIHYGRHRQLEFAIDLNSESNTTLLSDPESQPIPRFHKQESLLSPHPGPYRIGDPVAHRVLKMSRTQSENWMAQASKAAREVFASSPPNKREPNRTSVQEPSRAADPERTPVQPVRTICRKVRISDR